MSKKHMGSSIDDFLKEEGIFEKTQAIKEVFAWHLAEAGKNWWLSPICAHLCQVNAQAKLAA